MTVLLQKAVQLLHLRKTQRGLQICHAVVVTPFLMDKIHHIVFRLLGKVTNVVNHRVVTGNDHSAASGGDDFIAIDEKYLKPLYDEMEYMQFYKREFHNKCGFAIVCQNALELEAVIMPIMLGEEMAKELLEIGMFYNSTKYKALRENMKNPVSTSIPVDLETGEVIDEDSKYTQETF